MVFSSIHFLFLFFPLFLIFYYLFPRQWYRNAVLSIGSLVFFVWADPSHVYVLIVSVLLNYISALLIDSFQKRQKLLITRLLIWLVVVLNIAILVFFKYLGFFTDSFQNISGVALNFKEALLPLGVSYFTFSGISYVVDVYQQVEHAEKNPLKFCSYIVMFPKIIQGPITRYGQVKNELNKAVLSRDNLIKGIRRLIVGLAKKVLIADNMAIVANGIFGSSPEGLGIGVAWVGVISYSLQLYFDFSGYTDMAIGLGLMLGFNLPENFNFPYISRSISDFWRRWHMTLTGWFRTYVFIPLEFARKKEKFLRQPSNIVIVFLLTGLWHGAGWNYIIWGVYFGIILAVESALWGKILKKIPRIFQHFYTLILIMTGWIIFRLTDLATWKPFMLALLGRNGWSGDVTLRTLNILFYMPVLIIAVVLCTPIVKKFEQWLSKKGTLSKTLLDIVYLLAFVIVIIYILTNGYLSFLYAQV